MILACTLFQFVNPKRNMEVVDLYSKPLCRRKLLLSQSRITDVIRFPLLILVTFNWIEHLPIQIARGLKTRWIICGRLPKEFSLFLTYD